MASKSLCTEDELKYSFSTESLLVYTKLVDKINFRTIYDQNTIATAPFIN